MKTIKESKAENRLPENGTKVRIADKIDPPEECGGFLVHQRHLLARKPGAVGEYVGWVPGAGGDLWWIKHEDGSIGAYMFTEVNDL